MSEEVIVAARAGDEEAALRAAHDLLREGQTEELVQAVLLLLADDSAWLREAALGLLRRIPPAPELVERLLTEIASSNHADRRNAARSALSTLAAPGSADPSIPLPYLLDRLQEDPDADVRILVANALGEAHNPRARESLEQALHDMEPNVVAAAAEALGELNDPRAVAALIDLADRRDFWTGNAAAMALGRLADPRSVPALTRLTSDPWLAAEAARALGSAGDPSALDALQDMMEMPEEQRWAAIQAAASIIGRTGAEVPGWLRGAIAREEQVLADRLADDDDPQAARLLGMAGTEEAMRALLDRLPLDPDGSAAVGLEMAPDEIHARAILTRLESAPQEQVALLLTNLPALAAAADIESVARWLSDPDHEIRIAAAEALSRADPDATLSILESRRQDPRTRLGVALAYGRMGSNRCTPLLEMLKDPDAEVRAAAAEGVGRCGLATVAELAGALDREPAPRTARALVGALGKAGGDEAVAALERVLATGDPALRFEAVHALGMTASPRALEPLLSALADPETSVRTVALSALGKLGDPRAEEPLARHIDDPDRDRRRLAAAALDRLHGVEAAARLEGALHDPDREVRLVAIEALARLRLRTTAATLERLAAEDPDPLVRHRALAMADRLQDPPAEAQ